MAKVRAEIAKRIVGQEGVVELVLLTLLCGGNSLLMGVPGLAKTMLVNTVAQALALSFSRIQFTPDLMPSDITGTDLVQENPATAARELKFLPGPVFANIVLADEINRTPPKTQAALLEAMQEHRVTVQGRTYALDEPFFVFATQNPIELEGTYPLPEAQLDRFAFEIVLDYLPEDDELAVVQNTTGAAGGEPDAVIGASALIGYQQLVRRVPAADTVARYALRIVRASRPTDALATSVAQRFLAYGASVRAAQYLVLAGKARALTRGRAHVGFEDIRALALPVLRHRLLRNFKAESEGVTTGQVISDLIANISEPALV
ncbi:MAG: AAA domain-containing protein [Gammaproteobacteria bacterium]|nr:AAA domain-containing protein [Gammaproteobacteria bacterium]